MGVMGSLSWQLLNSIMTILVCYIGSKGDNCIFCNFALKGYLGRGMVGIGIVMFILSGLVVVFLRFQHLVLALWLFAFFVCAILLYHVSIFLVHGSLGSDIRLKGVAKYLCL